MLDDVFYGVSFSGCAFFSLFSMDIYMETGRCTQNIQHCMCVCVYDDGECFPAQLYMRACVFVCQLVVLDTRRTIFHIHTYSFFFISSECLFFLPFRQNNVRCINMHCMKRIPSIHNISRKSMPWIIRNWAFLNRIKCPFFGFGYNSLNMMVDCILAFILRHNTRTHKSVVGTNTANSIRMPISMANDNTQLTSLVQFNNAIIRLQSINIAHKIHETNPKITLCCCCMNKSQSCLIDEPWFLFMISPSASIKFSDAMPPWPLTLFDSDREHLTFFEY